LAFLNIHSHVVYQELSVHFANLSESFSRGVWIGLTVGPFQSFHGSFRSFPADEDGLKKEGLVPFSSSDSC
jgi:hypothetical protein